MIIEKSKQTHSHERLLSLDMFRGFTIMGMILVNNPGSWSHIYPPLRHAKWNGCTFTDLIFPFFLFIVGVAMTYSFKKRLEQASFRKPLVWQIIRRTLILFGLGLFLNWQPFFNITTARIPGVLQRIALCYFFASWILLYLKPKWQWVTAGLFLVLYWIGMKLISVPDYGAGVLQPEGSFCWHLDNLLLAGRTWENAPAAGFDPEGVWSTLPAIVTTLLGAFTGQWLQTKRSRQSILIGLFVGANLSLLTGYILTIWFPLNKNLWTVSYVFHTAGFAGHFLGMFYWLVDMQDYKKIATPFVIFGSNAIFVYVLSSAVGKILGIIQLNLSGGEISVQAWLYRTLFVPWAGELNGSLFYAIFYVLFWLGVTYLVYRKRIFIKV